jgi:isopenicillin N synthase-like dioxygenase
MSGATSFTSVPIIDISGLRSPDRAQREHVAREIGKAAGEVGFLYVSGAGVDDAVFERMLAATKQFFALPADEKMRYYIGLSSATAATCHPVKKGLRRECPR